MRKLLKEIANAGESHNAAARDLRAAPGLHSDEVEAGLVDKCLGALTRLQIALSDILGQIQPDRAITHSVLKNS